MTYSYYPNLTSKLKLQDADILSQYTQSDHYPITISLNIPNIYTPHPSTLYKLKLTKKLNQTQTTKLLTLLNPLIPLYTLLNNHFHTLSTTQIFYYTNSLIHQLLNHTKNTLNKHFHKHKPTREEQELKHLLNYPIPNLPQIQLLTENILKEQKEKTKKKLIHSIEANSNIKKSIQNSLDPFFHSTSPPLIDPITNNQALEKRVPQIFSDYIKNSGGPTDEVVKDSTLTLLLSHQPPLPENALNFFKTHQTASHYSNTIYNSFLHNIYTNPS